MNIKRLSVNISMLIIMTLVMVNPVFFNAQDINEKSSSANIIWEHIQEPENGASLEYHDVVEAEDGYFAVGYEYDNTIKGDVGVIDKYDESGNRISSTKHNHAGHITQFTSIAKGSSGNYMAVGFYSTPTSDYNAMAVNFDEDGNVISSTSSLIEGSGTSDNMLFDVVEVSDNQFLAVGYATTDMYGPGTDAINHGGKDIFIAPIMVNADGSIIFTSSHQYGTSGSEQLLSINNTSDGNCIVSGTYSNSGIVAKISSGGNILWTYSPDVPLGQVSIESVMEASNGNYIATGYMIASTPSINGETSYGSDDAFIIELDANGNMIKTIVIGTAEEEQLRTIIEAEEGIYVGFGNYYETSDFSTSQYYAVVVDNNLNVLDEYKWGNQAFYIDEAMVTSDGNIMAVGLSGDFNKNGYISKLHYDTGNAIPVDITKPIITADEEATVFVGTSNVDYINDFSVIATDDVDGDITSDVVVDDSSVDLNTVGDYKVKFNVTDSSGNSADEVVSTLHVVSAPIVDTTKPIITADGEATVFVGTSNVDYINEFNVIATDDIDGDITSDVVVDDISVDLNTVGDYQVKFNVTDSSGNVADEVVSTLHVVNAPTTVTYSAEITTDSDKYELVVGDSFDPIIDTNAKAHVYDQNGNEVLEDIPSVVTNTVDTNTEGSYEVSYGYVNNTYGVTANKTISVEVKAAEEEIVNVDDKEEDGESEIAITGSNEILFIAVMIGTITLLVVVKKSNIVK